jgi:hypothetical protein
LAKRITTEGVLNEISDENDDFIFFKRSDDEFGLLELAVDNELDKEGILMDDVDSISNTSTTANFISEDVEMEEDEEKLLQSYLFLSFFPYKLTCENFPIYGIYNTT